MESNESKGTAFKRASTLLGVIDYVEAHGGVVIDSVADLDEHPDGTPCLLIDKARNMAYFDISGERWTITFTVCNCCPAIHGWEPYYFESDDTRVGKRIDEWFPGTEEAIRVARAWVLERQMKTLAKSSKGFG